MQPRSSLLSSSGMFLLSAYRTRQAGTSIFVTLAVTPSATQDSYSRSPAMMIPSSTSIASS